MTQPDDTETQSYREEQGKPPKPTQEERMGDVPLVPGSAGIVRGPPPSDETAVDEEREIAAERERPETG